MKATCLSVSIILLSCFVVAGRLSVPGHGLSWPGTYEAFAHIWVGFLIAVAVLRWKDVEGKPAVIALLLLTVFETVAFLMRSK